MSDVRLSKLLENAPLESHTTFGVQQRARYLIEVNDLPELYEAVEFARDNHLELLVLGGGSNVLFVRDFPGLIVIIKLTGIVREGTNKLRVAAGENWHDLVEWKGRKKIDPKPEFEVISRYSLRILDQDVVLIIP